MLAILNSLNAQNLPIFQPTLMILVSKFMVHGALSDKTYLSLGLLSPLNLGLWTHSQPNVPPWRLSLVLQTISTPRHMNLSRNLGKRKTLNCSNHSIQISKMVMHKTALLEFFKQPFLQNICPLEQKPGNMEALNK